MGFLAKKICRIVMLSRITLYIGVVSAVVICASAIPVGLSDTSDELSDEAYNLALAEAETALQTSVSDEAYNLALAEAETALQTSEGNGFGDAFKNIVKTVHNAALQAKIKKADEDYKKALGGYVASSLVLSAHHVALTLATAALNAAKALPVTGSAWAKMVATIAKSVKIAAAAVRVASAKVKMQAAKKTLEANKVLLNKAKMELDAAKKEYEQKKMKQQER